MTSIKIESINCRGIRNKGKRVDIFNKAREEHIHILCLQETHITAKDLNTIKNEWNVTFHISGNETNSGGVLIAIDNNFEYICHNNITDPHGRYLILDIELVGVARLLLINIYAPNEDEPQFFENLFNIIESLDTKNLIIVGDWNLVIDFELDTLNYKKNNNIKAREKTLHYMEKLDLIDIWRQTHEKTQGYTWRQNYYKKMARLDFFLISETLLDIYSNSKIKPSYKSDHCPIQLELFISKDKKGKGIWKLNNSLLTDSDLSKLIKDEISLCVSTYACTPYHPEYIKNYSTEKIELMIEIDLFWEVLQAQLRGIIITYASKKKKKQQAREKLLITEIERDTPHIHEHISNLEWMRVFNDKERELEELREYKLKGSLIRARWQQLAEGEKPSKFFLNLENRNFVSKHIRELKVGNHNITKPTEILNNMKTFYETLYKEKNTINNDFINYKHITDKLPKLNREEQESIEREINIEDLKHIVYKSKNNKSPGPDGFSNEFYKSFWDQIQILLLQLMNHYREKGELNKRQISGIITCIPKGGKIRNDLKNWRPITLLNSIYKFYSGILAERIKNLLPKLIHVDQKGFINGRFIGENTRLTYDIINECESKKMKGLIILIDFEKAFDSISWEFILNSLKIFNFGENIISWVKSLQINSNSKILQNGYLSDEIALGRGCRQGDPISPYLFVLAAEFLAESIRSNNNIKGINIQNKEHKLSQYADDTTLFLKLEEKSMRSCMDTLLEFEQMSGLKVNKEKTKVVQIGGLGDNRIEFCKDLKLLWTTTFTSLGITYDVHNMDKITDQNIESKIKEINKLIMIWNGRNITPYGKITITKSLLISKITHILLSLPSPKENTYKKLENIFKEFIWNMKPPKFRKEILETNTNLGGLKMTNLKVFNNSLKLSWLKRLKNSEDGWEQFPRQFNIHKIILYGDNYPNTLLQNTYNPFWKDVILASRLLQIAIKKTNIQTYNIPLWFNSEINIAYKKEWYIKGYTKLSDILDEEGKLLSNVMMTSNGLKLNFLEYEKLRFDISKIVVRHTKKMNGPYIPILLLKTGFNMKGCSQIYNTMMNQNQNLVIETQQKWELTLNEEIPYHIVERSFKQISKMKEGSFTRYLQFRLLHNRIVTNKKLYAMGLSETSNCPYCGNIDETIEHAFVNCITVKNFWNEIERWLRQVIEGGIKISDIEKIMGTGSLDDIIDKTILATKKTIYRNRQTGKPYSLNEVKACLKSQMLIEEHQANIDGNERSFLHTWAQIYQSII